MKTTLKRLYMKHTTSFTRHLSVLLLVLTAFAAPLQAQQLSEPLETFKQNCLSERAFAQAADLDGLDRCAKAFRRMSIAPLAHDVLTPHEADTLARAGHLQFSAKYIDTLIICHLERMQIKSDLHITFRNTMADISISHQGIPARSHRSFTFRGLGQQEFLVISEDEGDLRIEVTHPATNTHYVSGATDNGVQAFSWDIGEEESPCTLTIVNPTDRDILCVIASN